MIRYIYTFFVGLFLAVFVGLGIAVFYESPKAPEPPTWYSSPEVKRDLNGIEKQQENVYTVALRDYTNKLQVYNRNVSIIVLIVAVLILIISLVYIKNLGIVADGMLIGGIFTLLYGIGVGMATDNNKFRFVVAGVGLVITLVLGYIKFTRHQPKKVREEA